MLNFDEPSWVELDKADAPLSVPGWRTRWFVHPELSDMYGVFSRRYFHGVGQRFFTSGYVSQLLIDDNPKAAARFLSKGWYAQARERPVPDA